MALPRFATAREMVAAFPFARYELQTPPTDQTPVEFIQSLAAAGNLRDAITCCAYLLSRREAVWWACRSVRASKNGLIPDEIEALAAAEAWAETPQEDLRLRALQLGGDEPSDSAAIWACRGAAFSGGIVSNTPKGAVRASPEATARAARAAVLIAATTVARKARDKYFMSCIQQCLELVRSAGE
jgi:hypothetical protein